MHVRQRLYLVEDIDRSSISGSSTLVRLSCVDDDAQGQQLDVLWENELDAQLRSGELWQKLSQGQFDSTTRFAAYLNAVRWNCVTATDPTLLQSPFRAGIKPEPYQFEPLRRALRLPRVNLFIADDVGLGKTIEAGLIARELLLRKRAKDVIVSCPPSMLSQWQDELLARFGLRFEILDKDYFQRVRRERGFNVNPWSTQSRFLISHRLLIDDAYTSGLREWLGTFRPGSLLILDEAHHAAPAAGQKYAIDSQITRAVRELAKAFEHRLFLSATPHNGHSNSFSALLEILDPQRFIRGVKPSRGALEGVMVRRLKEDLRSIDVPGFPKRHVKPIVLEDSVETSRELQLAALLSEYGEVLAERLGGASKRTQATSGLLLSGLQQRLFSSVEAFARTLRKHRGTVTSMRDIVGEPSMDHRAFDLLRGSLDRDDERAQLDADEIFIEEGRQIELASRMLSPSQPSPHEVDLLDRMVTISDEVRSMPDARVRHLLNWINRSMCPRGTWNDVRVIIFTEYEDTIRYLDQILRLEIGKYTDTTGRIRIFRGSTSSAERDEIKLAFNEEPSKAPVRILLATDAAREGLNLQAHCNHLFHFDVPWNPSRMEQRNGRIDRKLQPEMDVYCYYFVYRNRPEDRILATLVRKTQTIRDELGSLSQVIDEQLDVLLKNGIRRSYLDELDAEVDQINLPVDQRETMQEELESNRKRHDELRESIDDLRKMMERSRRELELGEHHQEHFRAAISCALDLMHAPGLQASDKEAEFLLPKLDERLPSWAETMDSLRVPRKREQKLFEWRNSAQIRPVVFEDPGRVTDEVVQLHLEQRVVQRLLGRLLSQGFVHHDLSRACLAQTQDTIPRIILIGRLALYGPHAARLHEEVVYVSAPWTEPEIRKGALKPYVESGVGEKTVRNILETALLSRKSAAEVIQHKLLRSAAQDVKELLPHLEERSQMYAKAATEKLADRSEKEARDMAKLLTEQRAGILARQHETRQRPLNFSDDEYRQLEADRNHWQKRLLDLEKEITDEPNRIRHIYSIQAQRIEPVGLVYLWPAGEAGS